MSQETPAPATSQESQNNSDPAPEVVSKSEHERAIKDMLKFKAALQEAQAQLEATKVNGLKAKEEWKTVAELKEQEAKEAKEKLDSVQAAIVRDKKAHAVREAAMKAGIHSQALDDLDLLDLSDVQIETTSTGRVNVLGADQFVNKIKATRPFWFGSQKAPNVNTADPSIGNGPVTAQQVYEALKKGDNAAYQDLHKRFQQQKLRRV